MKDKEDKVTQADNEPKTNIDSLKEKNAFTNRAKTFFESEEVGAKAVIFFGLKNAKGESINQVFDNPNLNKENYDKIPKYYKSSDKFGPFQNVTYKPFNNGKELIELNQQISDQFQQMKTLFADKIISPKLATQIRAELYALDTNSTRVLLPELVKDHISAEKDKLKPKFPSLLENQLLKEIKPKFSYEKVLSQTAEDLAKLKNISAIIAKQESIAYGNTALMEGAAPTKEEVIKALSKVIIEQKKFTKLDLADAQFKDKLNNLDPQSIGKIEIAFEKNDIVKATYSINNQQLIEFLKNVDPNIIPKKPLDQLSYEELVPFRKQLSDKFVTSKEIENLIQKIPDEQTPDLNKLIKDIKKSPKQKNSQKETIIKQASENISYNPEKKGNIPVLSENAKIPNMAKEFLESKKFGSNEIVYFNLGIPKDAVARVYNANEISKEEYNNIPKFYKAADGTLKDYNNGKELKETFEAAINVFKDIQNKYGDKNFSPSIIANLNQKLGKETQGLNQPFNIEDFPATLENAKRASLRNANMDIQKNLEELNTNTNLPNNFKTQITSLLNNLNKINDPGILPDEVNNLSKIVRQDLGNFLKNAQEKGINNENINSLNKINSETVNLRISFEADYDKILNKTKQHLINLQKISEELSKEKSLTYALVNSITTPEPSREDLKKAFTQILTDQQKITGIDPNAKDFHKQLAKLNPQSLGEIKVGFIYNQESIEYKVDNKLLLKTLNEIKDPKSLNLASSLVIKPKGFDKEVDLSIGKNDLIKVLKDANSQDFPKKLKAEDLGNVRIEFAVSKDEAENAKANRRESAISQIQNSLDDRSKFKSATWGIKPEFIEDLKFTFDDLKNNKKIELKISSKDLGNVIDKTFNTHASEVEMKNLGFSEKQAVIATLSKYTGKAINDEKIFQDKQVIPLNSLNKPDGPRTSTNIPTPTLNKPDYPNIVFPEQAREVFHQLREGRDINQSQTLDNNQRRENRAANAEIDSSIKAPPSQAKQATEPQTKPLGAQASSRSSQQAEAGITKEGVETTARVSQPPNRPPPEIPKARAEVKDAAAEVAQSPLKVDQKEWDNFAAKFANNQEKASNPEVTNAKAAAGAEVKPATGIANEGKETSQAVLQEGNRSRSTSINNVENTTRSRSDSVSDKDFDKILKEMNENLAGLEQFVKGKETSKSKGLKDALKEFDVAQEKTQESIIKENVKDRTVTTEKFVEADEKLTKKLNKVNENNVEKYNENNLDKEAERAFKKLAKFDKEMTQQAEVETKQTEVVSKEPRSRASSIVEPPTSQSKATNSASISSEEPPPITRPRSNAIEANNFNLGSNEVSQDKNTKVFENKQSEVQTQSSNTEKESQKWKEATPSPGFVEAQNEHEATQEEAKKKQGFLKRVMNAFKPLTDFIKRNNERSDHNVKEMAEKVASAHEAESKAEPKKVRFEETPSVYPPLPPGIRESLNKGHLTEVKEAAKKENITHPPSTPKGEIKIGKHRENSK